MKVVADTGPINYLVWIGHISLLLDLFGEVFVPEEVRRELEHPDAPSIVRQWIVSPPDWLSVSQAEPQDERGLEALGSGERGSIALAQALRADFVLMDDRLGVSAARARGLVVTGTLGVLARGASQGLVDLADAFDDLRRTSFRVRPEILDAILARHRYNAT